MSDEDKCTWTKAPEGGMWESGCGLVTPDSVVEECDDFRFCPYCGKPIWAQLEEAHE